MVGKPWTKRSLPIVTSYTKYGPALYAFVPTVGAAGMFTNDDLFKRLDLKVPQTFSQLLSLCGHGRAHGTAALVLDGGASQNVANFLTGLAVPSVYATDTRWTAEQRAGKQTFAGSSGR